MENFLRFCHQHKFIKIFDLILFFAIFITVINAEQRIINVNNPGPGDKVDILQFMQLQGADFMRNALKSTAHNRWTKYRSGKSKYLIPYSISGAFNQNERNVIRKAMHSIDKNTCIRFKQRKSEADFVDIMNQGGQGKDVQYWYKTARFEKTFITIEFAAPENPWIPKISKFYSCYTMVGMVRGNNLLMLESSPDATCITHYTVVHELMHKIGLWHEQMRYDRDKYIKVHWENIPSQLRSQFEKVPSSITSTYRVRYDYRSVMHYTKNAFATSPERLSMETKDKRYQNIIGNVQRASRGDWIKICGMYKCHRCMGKPFKTRSKSKGKRKKKHGKKAKAEPQLLVRANPMLLANSDPKVNGTLWEEAALPLQNSTSKMLADIDESSSESSDFSSAEDSASLEKEENEDIVDDKFDENDENSLEEESMENEENEKEIDDESENDDFMNESYEVSDENQQQNRSRTKS